jgi:hypothetical protein
MTAKTNQSELAKALLGLGTRVVKALEESSPEALDYLDDYTEAFDKWQSSWESEKRVVTGATRELGEQIAQQHATVVALTEEMLHSVEQSLRELRGWSKGIRAYMDHFPKQVSTMKTRKG